MGQQPTSAVVTSLAFFAELKWIDGRPLLDTIEPYRRRIFTDALDTYRPDGTLHHNFVLTGRGKKNWKSADLVLAALYCLVIRESGGGNDCYIIANDEDQAGDDLELAKKLVAANPDLKAELQVLEKEIRRRDGVGSLAILPARDAVGQHGKTALFVGFDEIHGYRNYDQFEALAPDPTRPDAMMWVASYDTIYNRPGIPLHDFKAIGRAGSDPRMLFSWYSGDFCTDPEFGSLGPELRANPSIGSWPEGRAYLEQQRRRLPSHKFRRLHLNLPGAPNGAFLDQGAVLAATRTGKLSLPFEDHAQPVAFVDMSGGSTDDACCGIAQKVGRRLIVNFVVSQPGTPPFNPRSAISKFVAILKDHGITRVMGDKYAGETFKSDFEAAGIACDGCPLTKTALYEHFEPRLNAGEIELPDIAKLQEQLLTLIVKGAKIDHETGNFDDWANAAAGAVWCADTMAATPSLWTRAAFLVDGKPAQMPRRVDILFAVIVADAAGRLGVAYFALQARQRLLWLLDVSRGQLTPALLAETLARLEAYRQLIRISAGAAVFCSASIAAELARLRYQAIAIDAVLADDLLAVAAATHVGAGGVRLCDDVVHKDFSLGFLDPAGAVDDGDPLRVAVLAGIAVSLDQGRTLGKVA